MPSSDAASALAHGGLDDETFGPANATIANGAGGAGGKNTWDQFSANEQLFGVRASFDEEVYTTKLDRSAPDFKERERRAARIASEIIGVRFLLIEFSLCWIWICGFHFRFYRLLLWKHALVFPVELFILPWFARGYGRNVFTIQLRYLLPSIFGRSVMMMNC